MRTGADPLSFCLLSFCLLALFPLQTAWSQDAGDAQPVRCISLSRIDQTEVINEYTIAFRLRGGEIYLNRMNRACNGLRDDKPFSYSTTASRLCSIDMITVLDNFGADLSRGASCALGVFTPTDEETLAMLKMDDTVDDPIVTVEEIELERGGAEGAASDADAAE